MKAEETKSDVKPPAKPQTGKAKTMDDYRKPPISILPEEKDELNALVS